MPYKSDAQRRAVWAKRREEEKKKKKKMKKEGAAKFFQVFPKARDVTKFFKGYKPISRDINFADTFSAKWLRQAAPNPNAANKVWPPM